MPKVLNQTISMYGTPEIFNTDQGSQFTSNIFTKTLKDKEIKISMDGKGRATDNIFVERLEGPPRQVSSTKTFTLNHIQMD